METPASGRSDLRLPLTFFPQKGWRKDEKETAPKGRTNSTHISVSNQGILRGFDDL